MSFELTNKKVHTVKICAEGNMEQSVDSDMLLPDYCPDVQKILKCMVMPKITAAQINGDRANVEGSACIRVIYSDDEGKMYSFELDYPFSKYADLGGTHEQATLSACAKMEYVNCRAVSPRRIDIHGMINISYKVQKTTSEDIINDAVGSGIQTRKSNIQYCDEIGVIDRNFTLSEVAELKEGMPSAGKILFADSCAVVNETKIVTGKILLKGDLTTNVLYTDAADTSQTENFVHIMPISQILDFEGVEENCLLDIKLSVTGLDVIPRNDTDNEQRLFDINARVGACVYAYEPSTANVITDTYSTTHNLDVKHSVFNVKNISDTFSQTYNIDDTLDLTGLNPQKIIDVRLSSAPSCTCTGEESNVCVKCTVPVNILLVDGDSQLVLAERQLEFTYKYPSKAPSADAIKCSVSITPVGCTYSASNGGKIDIKAEFVISGVVFSLSSSNIVCDMQINDSEPKKKTNAALTIYFSDPDEKVWDIARRYNTTVDAVLAENQLGDDVITEKRMLLIPAI